MLFLSRTNYAVPLVSVHTLPDTRACALYQTSSFVAGDYVEYILRVEGRGGGLFTHDPCHRYGKARGDVQLLITLFKDITLGLPTTT